ncbi:MAG: hypothetical protein S4CHLAM123_05380 [Chlamydiales bacterium]|nr:hypothetical protein [Chlamydiales bacterium]
MKRQAFLSQISLYFRTHPVVALLGPRQCGKTTLAKMHCKNDFPRSNYFDLEDQTDLMRLQDPKMALERLEGLIVIDEIQLIPDLFKTLRVLVDQDPNKRFLILGSASIELIRQSSETLAGRIAYIELTPFSYTETHELDALWRRGGFPKSYLAENELDSALWRKFYISSFLERDIPQLGINIPAHALKRFWAMLAHYHGNVFNASELGRSFGTSSVTIRRYLDILTGTFMVRQLQPWHENFKKRQVKSPKIYFRDSGILHSILDVENLSQLQIHPKIGASWEGFALEELLRIHHGEAYFWSTHSGAELDLLILEKGKRLGFEFKYSSAPKMTKSMQISFRDLKLDELTVIYPGDVDYILAEKIFVKGLKNYLHSMIQVRS